MTSEIKLSITDLGIKSEVSREIEGGPISLTDLLDFFEDALRGCGYGFEGKLTIENEEN